VRWPARPAELRAGLDFFGSFCIKAKRTQKDIYVFTEKCLSHVFVLCLEPKKETWTVYS
jgi:hypothetical protein